MEEGYAAPLFHSQFSILSSEGSRARLAWPLAARASASRTRVAVQSGWRDQRSAASAAACGAAAEVPANGCSGRQRLGKGTVAVRSGLGAGPLGPCELYAWRFPFSSTAPTATTTAPSPGN